MVFGVGISLMLGLLVVFGIMAPVLTFAFGLTVREGDAVPVILPLMAFVAIFSFYFGGMASSYSAPLRRRVHGTLVAPAAFVISPALNLAAGNAAFPDVDTPPAVLFLVFILAISVAASYVGARRGESLYAYNRAHIERERRRKMAARRPGEAPPKPEGRT